MLLYVFYIAHIVGCMWHWLALLNDDEGMSWITRYGIQDKSLAVHYFSSIYWAITTMTTVRISQRIHVISYVVFIFVEHITSSSSSSRSDMAMLLQRMMVKGLFACLGC